MELKGRKLEIIKMLADGHKAKDIGQILSISARTVEKHIQLVKAKFQAKTASHLIAIAFRQKLIE
jgi:DNA-binding CsgD family transcriptional regulator